jgi:hypothetical protein
MPKVKGVGGANMIDTKKTVKKMKRKQNESNRKCEEICEQFYWGWIQCTRK